MAIQFLDSLDITGGEIQNVVIQNLGADPTGLGAGQIYYNTSSNVLKYYNGSGWSTLASASAGILTVTGSSGITATTVGQAVTVTADYLGTDNIVLSATAYGAGDIAGSDIIIFSDASDNNVKKANVSQLPFTANLGTVTSVGTANGTFVSGSGGPITSSGNLTFDLSATGTPSSSTYLRGDNTWATVPASYTGWTLAGDGGTSQTISSGNTATIAGGTAITTSAGATDTLTINHDNVGTAGTYAYPSSIVTNAQGHVTSVVAGSAPGTMSSFIVASDAGTSQTISNGNTLTISGGTGLTGTASATDTITINHDNYGTAGTYAYPASITTNAQGHITAVTAGSAPGTMSSWTLAGDTGTQSITDGNTATFVGGEGIVTSAAATDRLNVVLDLTELPVRTVAIDGANDYLIGLFDHGADQNKTLIRDLSLSVWGVPTQDLGMGSNKIFNVADPVLAQDAATKNYVDTTFAGSGALIFQGGYAATAAPNASAKKGWTYAVTTAGNGAGYWTTTLEVGDLIIANIDNPASEADWTEVNKNIDVATATVQGIANFPTAGGLTVTAGAVSMPDVVTAGTVGSATNVAQVTVDAKGRVTARTNVAIAIPSSQVTNFASSVQSVIASTKSSTRIGDGVNVSFVVNHGLGTPDVIVQCYDTNTGETVYTTTTRVNADDVRVDFRTPPAVGGIQVLIIAL